MVAIVDAGDARFADRGAPGQAAEHVEAVLRRYNDGAHPLEARDAVGGLPSGLRIAQVEGEQHADGVEVALVFCEAARGVENVVVDGRAVGGHRNRQALRETLDVHLPALVAKAIDLGGVRLTVETAGEVDARLVAGAGHRH